MWKLWVFALVLAGCDDGAPQADPDPNDGRWTDRYSVPPLPKIDVLFVIEATPTMCGEQASLARAAASFAEWVEFADVRFATITTTAATPEQIGAFVTGTPDGAACAAGGGCGALPPVQHVPYGSDFAAALSDLQCRVQPGAGQIAGFAGGLDALQRALSCDGPNAEHFAACCVDGRFDPFCEAQVEFLRPDALLTVLILSDRDDCSGAAALPGDDPSECSWYRDRLTPLDTYRRFMASLKAQPNELLLVEAIVGALAFTIDGDNPMVYDPGPPVDPRCDPADERFDPSVEWTELCCPEGHCRGAIESSCESALGTAQAGARYRAFANDLNVHPCTDLPHDECPIICTDETPLDEMLQRLTPFRLAYCLSRPPAGPVTVSTQCVTDECDIRVAPRMLIEGVDYRVEEEQYCDGGVLLRLDTDPAHGGELIIEYALAE